jgi:aminodeoxyfutalosine synthase
MEFDRIKTKALMGERISETEAVWLFQNAPFAELCQLADAIKRKRHGKSVFWVNNRQINYTNVCVLHCSFCAFSKIKKDSPTAYDWTIPQIVAKAREAIELGARELHIVGGLHPDHEFGYYVDMVRTLRNEFPAVCIKAFTAVEIQYFAKLGNRTVESILMELKDAGLEALPGGGAEILLPGIREEICGSKETGEEWIEVHRVAHKLGIPSNATMLFGHIESFEHRVGHMAWLRALEDEAPGFFAFIPLVFHPDNNSLGRRVGTKTSEEDRIRTIAVARIFLDNIQHIKAYWVQLGLDVARRALHAGASDLDGTIIEEKITQAAGSESGQGLSVLAMRNLILEEGLEPVERDALYREF